jgi:hypothetical protein
MRDEDDRRAGWFSSRQLDAHVLVMTLRQLLTAEQLEQAALAELGIDPAVGVTLAAARQRFEDALPGIKDMRDALMHFDEWSRGQGRGPQKERRAADEPLRDIARDYWRFGYDPNAGTVSFGPYTIDIDVAARAATELCRAIYLAAHEVDRKNTADLRAKTVAALTDAGIEHGTPEASLKVSRGDDVRIWLSLDFRTPAEEGERQVLAEQIVAAVASAGLRLVSITEAQSEDAAERLVRREALYVESAYGAN